MRKKSGLAVLLLGMMRIMARILVADDSTAQIDVVSDILQRHQHDVIVAHDGLEACNLAVSEQPDVIVMDVVMPNLNGFQATRKITQNPDTQNIPIIMLTAKEQEADKVWAIRQGARAYVSKPADENELISIIGSLVNA